SERCSLPRAAEEAEKQGYHEQHEENVEQYLCDTCRCAGKPAKAEGAGHQRHDEKHQNPIEHVCLHDDDGRQRFCSRVRSVNGFGGSVVPERMTWLLRVNDAPRPCVTPPCVDWLGMGVCAKDPEESGSIRRRPRGPGGRRTAP